MTRELTYYKLKALKDNAIFESKEDEDSIEHIDMGYAELMELLEEALIYLEPDNQEHTTF